VDLAYFSVDVETAGPVPERYDLLSIGACLVDDPEKAFYVELRPARTEADPDALKVSGLSLERLASVGEAPEAALPRFADWVDAAAPEGSRPLFVAFNAPFDWMFLAGALHRYAGRNPFGHAALDVKALAMGALKVPWCETGFDRLAARFGVPTPLPHHALEDARLQAVLFRRILAIIQTPGGAS
jgi:DNA polymerase III epsilon subunit-like protein